MSIDPKGGTEILYSQLSSQLNLENINLIRSACNHNMLDPLRPNILWQHHSYDQSAVNGLLDQAFVDRLDFIVFVSYWQMNQFLKRFSIPKEKCLVIRNATVEFPAHKKPKGKIRLIYTSTPWRGLETLIKVYKELNRNDIELVVYSGTSIYGQEFYNKNHYKYEHLYKQLCELPNVTHYEYASNIEIREALSRSHIFAYPNTWEETSCVSAIEALCAGCKVVTTNIGALPETCNVWASMTPVNDDLVNSYKNLLNDAIDNYWDESVQQTLCNQVKYYNANWTWTNRINDWNTLLDEYSRPVYYGMVTTENSKKYTKPALDSFFNTTPMRKNDRFFLISNDGSFVTDKDVELVINDSSKSFSKNVNQVLKKAIADGAHFIFLNNDVIFTPNWKDTLCRQYNGIRVANCNRKPLEINDPLPEIVISIGTNSPGLIPFFCFFVPHHIAKVIGLFDEQFVNGAEDVDYRVRAANARFPTEIINESFVYHYMGKSTWLGGELPEETTLRNNAYVDKFIKKWGYELTSQYIPTSLRRAKTCVYAIALNEIKHVDKFIESCKGADLIIVCDTGSTDGTVERLIELGAIVHNISQKPWRFDIARNTALSLVPIDVDLCLAIDLDEYLQPGWIESLQDVWKKSNGKVNRIRYDYIWSWQEDGSPGGRFYASKIHSRQGYRWHYPCHEVVQWCSDEPEIVMTCDSLQLQHHADPTKSRGQYLNLLKTGIIEEPYNDRARYYYARELMFNRQWDEAIEHFKIHIELPSATWKEERAASYRYMSHCFRQLNQNKESFDAAIKGILEWNETREPWMEIARSAYALKDWASCYWAALKALSIPNASTTYVSDPKSWGYEPYDLAALSSFYLGLYKEALKYGKVALEKLPNNQRLQDNIKFYLSKDNSQES